MPRSRQSLSLSEARRVALAAQGFDRPRPVAANDKRHYRRALGAVGVLQLDFVNILLPAHLLIIWSRLGAYDRARFERFVYRSGEYTEQWAHEASVVRVSDWPLLGHRRRRFEPWKQNPLNQLPDRDRYLDQVLKQVRREGPLTSNDLPSAAGPTRKPGDWHRSISRWALEYHFGRGRLAVKKRLPNFQRVYDLPERVIDQQHIGRRVAKVDAQRELLRDSACRLGIATLQDLADYYRMSPRDAAPRIRELQEEGAVAPVSVEGWRETAYLASTARIPRGIKGACLLSPFDPVVWFRPRALRLFEFEYRIEIYVPAPRRRWGYYVIPFRLGDRIVARVDLKAERKNRRLLVQGAHLEEGSDRGEVAAALAEELRRLGEWLELAEVQVVPSDSFCALLDRAARAS